MLGLLVLAVIAVLALVGAALAWRKIIHDQRDCVCGCHRAGVEAEHG